MSRSGYSDECENLNLYRANADRCIAGKRGQAFLRELVDALDALPNKELIEGELVTPTGECCAMGAVALKRKLNVERIDPEDPEMVAAAFNINHVLAAEIAYENDEANYYSETPERRWIRMRKWAERQLAQNVPQISVASTQPQASVSEPLGAIPPTPPQTKKKEQES